ncbi:hypothetical protein PPIS_a3098 [Pseudoalteromonas piscicida]|uniref:NACHT domain-containing protein n=2 Tax=Pseudoalteromonas piscicida TaxID=43662 RepID=A0ABN5CEL7_PSEO7|nr:hypothetical protein [Pseudoalteromonas piscicida]ATD07948.1 hypothetical protein PPIS_a3098 [Pseudoalteromonas piscicida]
MRVPANKVYLACPEVVDDRMKDKIFNGFKKGEEPEILDGATLVKIIKEKAPKLYEKLKPDNFKIFENKEIEKTNHELLNAIKAESYIDIKTIYNDLSFFLGNIESKEALSSVAIPDNREPSVNYLTWNTVKESLMEIEDTFEVKLIEESELVKAEKSIERQKIEFSSKNKGNIEIEKNTFIKLNKKSLANHLNELLNQQRSYIQSINKEPKPNEIIKLLNSTGKSLKLLDMLEEKSRYIGKTIDFKESIPMKPLTVSPFFIFDTHKNLAVYGKAGAGKTTTLSQYAKYKIEKDPSSVIHLRLNKIQQDYIERKNHFDDYSKNIIYSFICINSKMEESKKSIDFIVEFLDKKVTLILDGLDEIYNSTPSILQEIEDLVRKHNNLQIIISTRDCVSYLKEIEFLGVTLEPFTKEQLFKFIKTYNGENNFKEIKREIQKNKLYEIINTPLLATVACELYNQGIKSFSNENEIYNARLRLLTGEYDSYKKIKPRTNLHTEHLQNCAIELAYYMHVNEFRGYDKVSAVKYLLKNTGYEKKLIENLLHSLQYDCNILFFDTSEQKYHFGHIRFQEHLAAVAIKSKPEFDWVEKLSSNFWRGALSLYAQSNSIEFLVNRLGEQRSVTSEQLTSLKHIVKSSPLALNRHLVDFLSIGRPILLG